MEQHLKNALASVRLAQEEILHPGSTTDIEGYTTQDEIELTDDNVYFIITKEFLPDESYQRLKSQIDDTWPKDKRRPILLENCSVVKL